MEKISKIIKKEIIPLILAVGLLMSSFGMSVSASTNVGADSIVAAGFSEAFLTSESNIVYGDGMIVNKTPETMDPGTSTVLLGSIDSEGNESSSAVSSYWQSKPLTDGALLHCDGRVPNYYFWDADGNARTDMFYDLVFKLDSKYSDIKMLVVDSSDARMRITDYSVYASATAEELFTGDPIISHQANAKQYNSITIREENIQYIALRIYGVCTAAFVQSYAYTSAYLRLMEVAMSGSKMFSRTESDTLAGVGLSEEKLQSSDNALYGFTYESNILPADLSSGTFSYAKGSISADGIESSAVRLSTDTSDTTAPRLVNGITDTGSGKNADCYITTFYTNGVKNTTGFTEITFNLGSVYKLDKLLIADAASAGSSPATNQYATDYSIFIGNSASELYVGSPVVSHAGNTKRFNLFDLSDKEAQYIGIRVYSACAANFTAAAACLRFSEVALLAEPKGITAEAKLEGAEQSEDVFAKVDKDNLKVGDVVTFSTECTNNEYIFKGWKDASGEFVSYDKSFEITVKEGDVLISYTAVYELSDAILIKEDFEGSTSVGGLSGLSIGTAESFYIKTRTGSETGKLLKFDKTTSDWGYAKFYKNGSNIFNNYALEENSAYKLTYWYYIESAASSTKPLFFTVPHGSYKIHPEENETTFMHRNGPQRICATKTGEWIKSENYFYTYDIPTLSDFIIYTAGTNCTTGVVYFDDIKLEKAAVIDLQMDEKEAESNIICKENFVGGMYEYQYGKKQIAEIGEYTLAPKSGYILSSVTLNGSPVSPEADGSYKLNISGDAKIVAETQSLDDWAKITVEQKSGTGKFVGIDTGYAAEIGKSYSFKFITGENANPQVNVGGETLTPADGIYTIDNIAGNTTIKIVCDGDEYRGVDGFDANGNDLTKYVKEIYDKPLWEGDIMYHETVTIYPGRTTARLIYPIDDIVSVRSFDLKKEYVWGVDYDVNDKGELVILEGNSFPCYDKDLSQPSASSTAIPDYGHLQAYGIDVTFKHSKTWEDGYQKNTVESGINELPKFYNKLKNKENIELVFYGASSTVGWSSSGLNEYVVWDNGDGTSYNKWDSIMIAPFVPSWARQTHSFLKSNYGYDENCDTDITFINRSCGGRSAAMAANDVTLASQFKDTCPDVVVLGFSGNDGNDSEYINNIEKIITYIRTEVNPECEIIVASSSLPVNANGKAASLSRIPELKGLCEKYEGQGVLYAPTLAFSNDAFVGLTACDYSANNYNHNNDFGVRAFTSVMVGLLSEPEKAETFEIVFKDAKGEIIHSATINEGETAKSAAAEAEAKLKSNYGYVLIGWSSSVDEIITENMEFLAVYKRDISTIYSLSIDGKAEENIAFDSKVTLKANDKVLWRINGEKFSIGSSAVAYAFGNMKITTEDASAIDENAPFVSLIHTVKDVDGGQYIAFVHTYDPSGEITEYGVSFWNANIASPTEFKKISFDKGNDAMATLYGIQSGKNRAVKGFAIIGNDVIYSETSDSAEF